ncbi:hypothetical protein SFR_5805 [Streptomyces sp. FR-008]|nr:hypothetical protein SFR_5805 [Streptomyces sp. FR-008]
MRRCVMSPLSAARPVRLLHLGEAGRHRFTSPE